MTERKLLLDRLTAMERNGQAGAVATVVRVVGSSYRRAGARMLISADGQRVGMLAGGCFDLEDRARQTMESGRTMVHRYDTTGPADAVLGSGSGCEGIVDILLAPVDDGQDPSLLTCLERSVRISESVVLATVVGPAEIDVCPARLGARLLITGNDPPRGNLGDTALQAAVWCDARKVLSSEHVAVKAYPSGNGEVQVMIERLTPMRRLVLFGAGEDSPPLVRIAAEVGLHVTVTDHRSAYADAVRLPGAAEVLHDAEAADAVRRIAPDSLTACVSMTHDYLRDVEILRELAGSTAAYVGVLGPHARAERLIADADWPTGDRHRLYCPAGIDIGADTPEGIALSVVAEVVGVLAARSGDHLRERTGPIHGAKP